MELVSKRNISKELLEYSRTVKKEPAAYSPPVYYIASRSYRMLQARNVHSLRALLWTSFTDCLLAMLTTQHVLTSELQVLKTDPEL
jgi:hypothetical protein